MSKGSLLNAIAQKDGDFRRVDIPAFVAIAGRKAGLINRSCTRDYKLRPIQKKMRDIAGITGQHAPRRILIVNWMGISIDEASRIKTSREVWIENRWPLIEKRMSRTDCLRWIKAHGYPEPPKSACTFCPYHSDQQWQTLTDAEIAQAIQVDDSLRAHPASEYRQDGTLYLHRSVKPLREVFDDFRFVRDFQPQPNLFENECEGMCGV